MSLSMSLLWLYKSAHTSFQWRWSFPVPVADLLEINFSCSMDRSFRIHNQVNSYGYSQIQDQYWRPFPFVQILVFRTLLEFFSLPSQHNKRLFSAFVNGVALRKRRFVVPSKKDYCVRLDNSLYCLKLSPRHGIWVWIHPSPVTYSAGRPT